MTIRTEVDQKLALHGGRPVRPKDRPLPQVFPRYIAPEAFDNVMTVLKSGFTVMNMCSRFEIALAKACGAKYAVSVANCTAVVHTAVGALNLEPGDEVIVTPLSDWGSVAGVIAHGLIPVFPDVDLRTGAITAETIAPKITARTRAIIAVHFYGLVCDMDPICELAKAHNLFLIEDVCQAPLATYKGRTVGSLADAACWSMDTEKHLSAAGGGAITTSRKDFADACRKYAWTRGSLPIPGYQGRLHDQFGLNYRCSNLNAGVALANLAILPDQNRKRAKMADRLTAQLRGVPGVQPPFIPEGCSHIYWVYHMLLDPTAFRAPLAEVVEAVNAEGLLSGMPMYYLIPEYITFIRDRAHAFGKSEFPFCFRPREEWPAYGADSVPKAKEHLTRTLQFPWTDKYEEPDVDDVAAIVRKVAGHYCR